MHEYLIQLIPWAVFVGIVCAVWGCASYCTRRADGAARLRGLNDRRRSTLPESTWRMALRNATENAPPLLAQALQIRDSQHANRLRALLHHAGYHASHALTVYMAIRSATTMAGGLLGAGIGLGVWWGTNATMLGAAIGVLVGSTIPVLVLEYIRKQRQEQIFFALPEALDLLIIAVEVGQGFDAAIQRVTREISPSARELADEFHMFNMQVHMGRNRRDALHDLGTRTGLDDMNALASVLIQADKFGGAVAQTLDELAESMRIRRQQLAEERAQKTAVKLLFPLVLFIFPGVFAILVGPAAILMYRRLLAS